MSAAARAAFERLEDTDEWRDLDIAIKSPVAMFYKDMLASLEAHKKPDRSALLRMAGNIAGGLCSNPALINTDAECEGYARVAVALARGIMKEIDR